MNIQFGLELEERVFPEQIQVPEPVIQSYNTNGLVTYLEKHLGISYPERHSYVRYEQYRQVLAVHLVLHPKAFYAASFEADSMATAVALLERRDELYINGWDFELKDEMPLKLRALAEIESLVQRGEPTELFVGFAERFRRVLEFLELIPIPLKKVYLNEPIELLPPHVQHLLTVLQNIGVDLVSLDCPISKTTNDLQKFQKALLKQEHQGMEVLGDGSLIILQAKRETYIAEYLAKLFLQNPNYQPVCLIPNKNRALDDAFVEEGLPSLGILSASLARPTLQILKLATTFLWRPINPYKILEFVSLPNTPIHPALARGIAKIIAQKPGLFSGAWNTMVRDFFEGYDERIADSSDRKEELENEKKEAQEEYRFWFNRRRYDSTQAVPKTDVIDLYRHIARWAHKQLEENKKQVEKLIKKIEIAPIQDVQGLEGFKEDLLNGQPALEGLRIQSNNIVQVLEALPPNDTHLSNLRLERLVRTINEPTAIRFRSEEMGHLPYIHKSSAVVRAVDDLFWWNFVDAEPKTNFSHWYQHEQLYLEEKGIRPETSFEENSRVLWQRMQAILKTQKRLILVMPQYIDGKEQLPHPLWGDLNAALGEKNLKRVMVNLDNQENIHFLAHFFVLPSFSSLQTNSLNKPKPYLYLSPDTNVQQKTTESYSSLDTLLYYPYQWLFKYQMDFHKSSILSVTQDNQLKGNIAHSVFEQLFNAIKESDRPWEKQEVQQWVEDNISDLFEREGAVLLMYGSEPERIGLKMKIKQSAWTLVSIIQKNNWKILATELVIHGKMAGQEIKGVVDLVLARGDERAIVDLKWSGDNFYKSLIKNRGDLQLVIYSKLLENPKNDWAYTAYFNIEKGKIIARNTLAFEEAEAVMEKGDFREEHHAIWTSMETTYRWRIEQIKNGEIEVRTEETCDEIEEMMNNVMDTNAFLDLLEMKRENARYDDYQVLISRVR